MILYNAKKFLKEVEENDEYLNKDRSFSDFKNKLIALKRQSTMKLNGKIKPNINIQK